MPIEDDRGRLQRRPDAFSRADFAGAIALGKPRRFAWPA
jgi:hypothetical protein